MKISHNFPDFHRSVLLVVAGKQEAAFHGISGDSVQRIHRIKIKKPEYTDREGFFARRGNNRTYGTGSVYEPQDNHTVHMFAKTLAAATETLAARPGFDIIYLFCPGYLAGEFEKAFSAEVQKKLRFIFYGNYLNQHAFVLLGKIQELLRAEAPPDDSRISGQAKTLLAQTSRIQESIKNRVY